jgi:fimbrial chaperone protein
MAHPVRHHGRLAALAVAVGVGSGPLAAAGLQVEPVTVTMQARSDIIWLTNTGDVPLLAQVRVDSWAQDPQGDRLEPSDALIASPPMVRIPAHGRQLVRLVSLGAASCEDTFRLKIDELPSPAPVGNGLRYVLHYSVPVFVTRRECRDPAPQLAWRLARSGSGMRLQVENSGAMHAQLARVSYIDPRGRRIELTPGLLGYVLSGSQMSFNLSPPPEDFGDGGMIELLVNGKSVVQSLPAG